MNMSSSSSASQRADPTQLSDRDGSAWKRQREPSNDGDRRSRRGYQTSQPSFRDEFAAPDNGGRNYYAERSCPKWTCSECKSENIDLGDDCCSNCRMHSRERIRSPSLDYYDNHRHASEKYRFDRHPPFSVSDQRRYHRGDKRRYENSRTTASANLKHQPSSVTMEWPPLFETDGAAYVFDSRSGLFYEGVSDFFFDPMTKLYFGNKQQLYYMHCPSEQPAFVAVQGGLGTVDEACAETPAADHMSPEDHSGATDRRDVSSIEIRQSDTVANTLPNKNKIAISIGKAKSLSQLVQGTKDNVAVEGAVSVMPSPVIEIFQIQKKSCVVDMQKWAKREEETSIEVELAGSIQQPKIEELLHPLSTLDSQTGKVSITADGRPICSLCKRKFASIEKLREHEEVSSLHKQNLLKSSGGLPSHTIQETKEYRDRAKERRALFGAHAPKAKAIAAHSAPTPSKPVVSPHENLGETNIGNKLLQKLGWKEGVSLGRNAGINTTCDKSAGENLKQAWERIEAIAGSETGRRQTSRGIGDV